MDDRFLNQLRGEPAPEFAATLRSRLHAAETRRAPIVGWRPVLAGAFAVAVVAALFAFPSVRASAQSVLDLFRVRNFAPVSFDPSRLEKLHAPENEPLTMLGKAEVLQDPGKPIEVPTPEAATARAGLDVRVPRDLPEGMRAEKILVEGAAAGRFTADAQRIRNVLETLALDDVVLPGNLDGKSVTVHKPPVVIQQFRSPRHRATLIQARSPEVELPVGIDLAELAEIGMRILGVDRSQARQIARSMDWHSTLLVPVPQNASSFRRVEVQGHPGLLITTDGSRHTNAGEKQHDGSLVLWSDGDRVFALSGDISSMGLVQMAESVR